MDIDGALMFGIPAGSGQVDAAIGYRYRMARKDVGWPLGDSEAAWPAAPSGRVFQRLCIQKYCSGWRLINSSKTAV